MSPIFLPTSVVATVGGAGRARPGLTVFAQHRFHCPLHRALISVQLMIRSIKCHRERTQSKDHSTYCMAPITGTVWKPGPTSAIMAHNSRLLPTTNIGLAKPWLLTLCMMLWGLGFCFWEGNAIIILQRALPLENLNVYGKPLRRHQGQDQGNRGHDFGGPLVNSGHCFSNIFYIWQCWPLLHCIRTCSSVISQDQLWQNTNSWIILDTTVCHWEKELNWSTLHVFSINCMQDWASRLYL